MIKLVSSSRFLWVIVAAGALVGLSGCQQVTPWMRPTPPVSRPAADPFGYTPTDTYFHRPEAAPELSPVPDLPAPGHSVPTDPPLPPPPAPAEGANSSNSGDSVTAKSKSMWNLRPMSFFRRKEPASDSVQSAANEQPRVSLADRSTTGTETALPVSKIDRTPSPPMNKTGYRPDAGVVSTGPSTVTRRATAPNQPAPLDDSYTGPVITPGAQYTMGRDLPIESWPHTPRTVNNPPVVRLRKQEPRPTAEDFAPRAPIQYSTSQPPAPRQSDASTVPLLLPPGP